MQRQQRSPGQENHQEGHAQLSHQQALPDFPMPPPATFDTPFEAMPAHCDGDLDLQLLPSPGSFNGFNDMWTGSFEQEAMTASVSQPDASTNGNNNRDGAPFTRPSDMRSECLKKLGDLQRNVLADLDTVKACKTADKCAQAATISSSGQSHNFLVGRMLDHSTALLEILDCFEPISTDPAPLSNEHGLHCDAPTMFSFFSCYVCLTRIYRTIFSCIHDSMPFLSGLQQPVPQLFPGMNLGGFKLDVRHQVHILVQVSEGLLAKIETKFGIAEDTAIAKGSIFEREKAAKMLRMMLEEEASEQPQLDERRGDCESLRDILASLKHMIQMEGVNKSG
jgi:hypothetical protein